MKVFISWSGPASRGIAEVFYKWIPSVIQAAKPYFSPDDIAKGARWQNEISNELEGSKIGLICLTAENLEAPWIMFEAGALSRSVAYAKVCPLTFGIEPSEIKGPLTQFQGAAFSKDEMFKVVRMMNGELGEHALGLQTLEDAFEKWWPDLEVKVKEALSAVNIDQEQVKRPERDMLEELLGLARASSIRTSEIARDSTAEARNVVELSYNFELLCAEAMEIAREDAEQGKRIQYTLRRFLAPLRKAIQSLPTSEDQSRANRSLEGGIEKLDVIVPRLYPHSSGAEMKAAALSTSPAG